MMGYTHVVTGAAAALAVASCMGQTSSESCLIAVTAGVIGGTAPDFDVKDQKGNVKVTDGTRSRIAAMGTMAVALLLDFAFGCGILSSILERQYLALGGLVAFVVLAIIGHFTDHRTFTHSLLCALLMSACVYAIYPPMAMFFFAGFAMHLLLDILNNPFHNHGVQLLYPIKTKNWCSLGWCKSGGPGNKAFYFIGLVAFAALICFFLFVNHADVKSAAISIVLFAYIALAMHFERAKSERELRHIGHIRGEL